VLLLLVCGLLITEATELTSVVATVLPVPQENGLPVLEVVVSAVVSSNHKPAPEKQPVPVAARPKGPSLDWEWSAPENLGPTVNGAYSEGAPFLTEDGLTLLFSSDRPGSQGNHDIWMTTRESLTSPWSKPVNLGPNVNSDGYDSFPCLSNDRLMLVFSSNREGGHGSQDLWMCRRKSVNEPWGKAVNLGGKVNSRFPDNRPALSLDGKTLYFARRLEKTMVSRWSEKEQRWGRATAEPALTLAGGPKARPWTGKVSMEDLEAVRVGWSDAIRHDQVLVFHKRKGKGPRTQDLWMYTRKGFSSPWEGPVNLGPRVNLRRSSSVDPCLALGGTLLVFSSNRDGGQGGFDLWMCRRVPKEKPKP
jgi:hypothetical protein